MVWKMLIISLLIIGKNVIVWVKPNKSWADKRSNNDCGSDRHMRATFFSKCGIHGQNKSFSNTEKIGLIF